MEKLTVPKELQPVAERHGQELFELTMRTGAINYAFAVIAQQSQGDRKIAQAIQVIAGNQLGIVEQALKAMGKGIEDLLRCRADIEALVELAAGQIDIKQSEAGIILQ